MTWSLIPRLTMLSLLAIVGCTKSDETDTSGDTDVVDDTDVVEDEICDDGEDNDGDQDVDCEDRDCRADDACKAEEFIDVFYVAIYTDFGFDADLGQVTSVTGKDSSGADVEINPNISIVLLTEDQSEYCTAYYESVSATLTAQNWTGANDFGSGKKTVIDHTGFVLDTAPESATFVTDCEDASLNDAGKRIDPDLWGDLATTFGAFTFGGGIGNPHEDVEANFDAIATNNKISVDQMVGGGFFVGPAGGVAADGDYIAASWAIGLALDVDGKIIVDDAGAGTLLNSVDIINDAGVPPTAYYRVFPAFVFGADFLLP